MSSFLVLLAAVASSALAQYPVPFNNGPQFFPTFQKFPQQFAGLQFPQAPLPFWPKPNQILGGQASLPPWLKPQADPLETIPDNAVAAVEAVNDVDEAVRFIDNTEDSKTAAAVVAVDDAGAAAQKAYEEYLKLCYTTNGGNSGSYSQPGML
jgi:hypothetical protein